MSLTDLVLGEPAHPNSARVVTTNRYEPIPVVLVCLVQNMSGRTVWPRRKRTWKIWWLDGLLIWLGSRSFHRGRLLGA